MKRFVWLMILSIGLFNSTTALYAQNYTQLSKLVAADRNEGNQFGNAVAISGNYAVVGAANIAQAQIANPGNCAYVFERKADGSWMQIQKLTPHDPEPDDAFGFSVSINGGYIIVGAPKHDHIIGQFADRQLPDAGAAYIFSKDGSGTWVEEKQLSVNATPAAGDMFGYSVSTDGAMFLIGAPGRDFVPQNPKKDCGEAYLFKKYQNEPSAFGPINGWGQYIDYTPEHPIEGQAFGASVSVDGQYAVVGSPNCSKDATNLNDMPGAGTVYVFITLNTSSNSSEPQYPVYTLVAPDRAAGDQFGQAVAIHGNLIIVGAPYEDKDATGGNRINAAGSAYVFQSTTTNVFDFTTKLVASDRAYADNFGSSVSIYNKYAVVGAIAEDEDARGGNTLNSSGSVYLFINDPRYYDPSGPIKLPKAVLSSSAWYPFKQIKLSSTDRAAGDWFGYAVAVNDSCIIIGTPLQDNDTRTGRVTDAGSVYIFGQTFCIKTSSSISPTACKTYTSPSNKYTWTRSGTYRDTIQNAGGCDSIITINLTIITKADTSVTVKGNSITANAQHADFMWIDCSTNGFMRNVPTLRTFTPTKTGTYAVHVNEYGCVGISSCYKIVVDSKPDPNDTDTTKQPPVTVIPRNKANLKAFLEVNKIVANDRTHNDEFGTSVSISGNYAIVGAPKDDDDEKGGSVLGAGSAYIFRLDDGGKWKQMQKISAFDRTPGAAFGCAVGICGNYLVVGANRDNLGVNGLYDSYLAGSAYVFQLINGTWYFQQKIIANPTARVPQGGQAFFGSSVAIDGGTIVIGCPEHILDSTDRQESAVSSAGALFVYQLTTQKITEAGTEKSINGWVQTQKLVAKDRIIGNNLGNAVAICGDNIIAGSWGNDYDAMNANRMEAAGAAYIFERQGALWVQTQKLVAEDRSPYDEFGFSVGISGDYAVVGARRVTLNKGDDAMDDYTGNAYIFKRNSSGAGWSQQMKINPEDRTKGDYLGTAVGISGDYLIASAWGQDTDSLGNYMADAGAVYVFYLDKQNNWVQCDKISPFYKHQLGHFGVAAAISDCNIIASSSTDETDEEDNNPISGTGAAYIFTAAGCNNNGRCNAPSLPQNKIPIDRTDKQKNINNNSPIIPIPKTDTVKFYNDDLSKIEMCIDRVNDNPLPPRTSDPFYKIIPTIKPDGELSDITSIKQGLSIFTEKMWNPGEEITVGFFPKGNLLPSEYERLKTDVKKFSEYWESIANIKFKYIDDLSLAKIKIVFQRDERISWSFLGRDVLFNPFGIATMSFGLISFGNYENDRATILHEFGHALGFIHEHQAPTAGIPWDKEKAYAFFGKPPGNLSRMDVDLQIFNKYSNTQINSSTYDSRSIMHYYYPAGLTTDGSFVRPIKMFSAMDTIFAQTVYPFPPSPQNANGTLHTRDDCDAIDFSVEYNIIDENLIEFILEPGKDPKDKLVTWWKKIGIPLKGGIESELEIENGSVADKKFPAMLIDNTRPISFWKAKLFGIHTLLNYKWDVLPAIIGGCRVRLTWKQDTCY